MKKRILQLWTLMAVLAISCAVHAQPQAQTLAPPQRDIPVHERPRPEYQPRGIDAGPFTVNSRLLAGIEYNDNIYAVDSGKTYDWITVAAPRIDIRSDWKRHALDLSAGLKGGFHAKENSEDYIDGHAFINGRVGVLDESGIRLRGGIERLHEGRGEPDVFPRYDEPVVYNRSEAKLSGLLKIGNASLYTSGSVVNMDFRSVALADGGSENLAHRDRDIYLAETRLSYDLFSFASPFLLYQHDWRRYDYDEPGTGRMERDSDGYRAGMGTGFDIGGVVLGEIFGGHYSQQYNKKEDISGPWFGTTLLINITDRTSVHALVKKDLLETTIENAQAVDSLNAHLSISTELLYNLIETIYIDARQNRFKGEDLAEDIEDWYYTAGYRQTYFWSPNIEIGFEYSHRIKAADDSSNDFSENRFQLSLTGKF